MRKLFVNRANCKWSNARIGVAVVLVLFLAVKPREMRGQSANAKAIAPRSPTEEDKSALAAQQFVDITAQSGVEFHYMASHGSRKYLLETMGPGVALFDFDNDGRLDLFVVNGAPLADLTAKGTIPQKTEAKYWNRLFHQKADGKFEDVTEKAGLQGAGYGMGVAVGDYDNDGYEDLYVTAYGGNKLYHNNGDGTFTDATEKAGVGGSGWSTSAAWVDLDGDGLLDLVVVRYLQWDFDDIWCGEHKEGYRSYCHPDIYKPMIPLVFHNDGKGHFSEVAQKIGLSKPGKGLGIAIADYDRDSHIDVFVANDSMIEFLYRNKGDGTFEEVGLSSGVAVDGDGRTYAGMGVDFADYDNDGLPDAVVTNLANQTYALYKNNGDGTFSYSSLVSGISRMTLTHSGWGVRFFDYDNDGWKDLLFAQGHDLDTIELNFPTLRYREPLLLARNTGSGFVDVSNASGAVFQNRWVARGLAIGDIDNDGRLDAVVTNNEGPIYILHNENKSQNHWLTLKLVGHKSNRDAIGAEIKLVTSAGPQWVTVTTTSSYLSSGDKRAHFGLGNDAKARTIEIRWPSGIIQTLENVAGDQILQIDEPAGPGAAAKSVNMIRADTSASALVSYFAFALSFYGLTAHAQSSTYEQARAAFSHKAYSRAAELFAKAEHEAPGSTDASLYESKALSNLGQFAEAEQPLREYIAGHGQSLDALSFLGFVLNRENKPLESLKFYNRAAELATPTGDDLKIVALNYVLLNDGASAIRWLEKSVDMDPNNQESWYFLGRAYFTEGRFGQAKSAFLRALALNPRDAKAEDNLGLLLEAENNQEAAEAAYQNAIRWQQSSGHVTEHPSLHLGMLYDRENRSPEALAPLLDAERIAPQSALVHDKLGETYLHLGQHQNARKEFESAVELDSSNASLHFHLGRAYKALGLQEEAKKEFVRSEQLFAASQKQAN